LCYGDRGTASALISRFFGSRIRSDDVVYVAHDPPQRVFGFTKVRYRGLKKNHEWLLAAFALVNLYLHRKRLVPMAG